VAGALGLLLMGQKTGPARFAQTVCDPDTITPEWPLLASISACPGGEMDQLNNMMSGSHTSIDLFAGAGGITEGFRQAGFQCVFANDFNANAMTTFRLNHPDARSESCPIEELHPAVIRKELGMARGELTALVGGPLVRGSPSTHLNDFWTMAGMGCSGTTSGFSTSSLHRCSCSRTCLA